MNLALFDFDGTLSTKDSLGEFFKYAVGDTKYYLTLIKFSPFFILWQLKLMKNYRAKEILFKLFFNDVNEKNFKDLAQKFSLEELDKILRANVYERFKKHINDGDRVIIVSASMKCWLDAWCKKENVELISTELLFENDKFSGEFATKNCHGIEKFNRINEHLNITDYDSIYAYGDSSGDTQMLEMADYKYLIKDGAIKQI
ncbi:HAD family hydrolase [Sulfurimonas sp.]|uniref:HAD family hydrolase n=1 Tax=Sulfurimonas sp. TaxID=2022749 RepID=UPI002AAF4FC7|nr:HAD family hydrolase [Sulfurimonas sp.]